jgi:hypothetical protein
MARKRFSRRRARSYPSRRYKAFRKGKAPISLLMAVPVAYKALVQPVLGGGGYTGAYNMLKAGSKPEDVVLEFANILGRNFSGYDIKDNSFDIGRVIPTYAMLAAGFIGSKVASKIGVNAQFKRIPMIGKYVKL